MGSRALLIVGHGSTVNADSSAPTLHHAAEIRQRRVFGEVACAFWKEEPSLRDARFLFDPAKIREVYVVPNFISEGYFTQTVIPRELELNGPGTVRPNGQVWNYCQPVGSNPGMTEILLRRAREIAPDISPSTASLLIVGHGTDQNENSAVAAKREAEAIRARGEYAAVLNAYMTGCTAMKTSRLFWELRVMAPEAMPVVKSFAGTLTESANDPFITRPRSVRSPALPS
jgi:sirohydrochlorin cobaltochelatase